MKKRISLSTHRREERFPPTSGWRRFTVLVLTKPEGGQSFLRHPRHLFLVFNKSFDLAKFRMTEFEEGGRTGSQPSGIIFNIIFDEQQRDEIRFLV
jgi:hypothetical protein